MPAKVPKTIRISEQTARRLMALGRFGESFDDVIVRILDQRETVHDKDH